MSDDEFAPPIEGFPRVEWYRSDYALAPIPYEDGWEPVIWAGRLASQHWAEVVGQRDWGAIDAVCFKLAVFDKAHALYELWRRTPKGGPLATFRDWLDTMANAVTEAYYEAHEVLDEARLQTNLASRPLPDSAYPTLDEVKEWSLSAFTWGYLSGVHAWRYPEEYKSHPRAKAESYRAYHPNGKDRHGNVRFPPENIVETTFPFWQGPPGTFPGYDALEDSSDEDDEDDEDDDKDDNKARRKKAATTNGTGSSPSATSPSTPIKRKRTDDIPEPNAEAGEQSGPRGQSPPAGGESDHHPKRQRRDDGGSNQGSRGATPARDGDGGDEQDVPGPTISTPGGDGPDSDTPNAVATDRHDHETTTPTPDGPLPDPADRTSEERAAGSTDAGGGH